jgi:hypothetical protein
MAKFEIARGDIINLRSEDASQSKEQIFTQVGMGA